MARIETFGRIETPQISTPSPGIMGQPGQALSQLGGQLADIGFQAIEKKRRADQQAFFAKESANASLEDMKAFEEKKKIGFQSEQDIMQFGEERSQRYKQLAEQARSQGYEEAANRFTELSESRKVDIVGKSIQYQSVINIAKRKDDFQSAIDAKTNEVVLGGNLEEAKNNIRGLFQVLREEKILDADDPFFNKMDDALGNIENAYIQAQYGNGNIDETLNKLKTGEFKDLTPDETRLLLSKGESLKVQREQEIKKQASIENSRVASEFEVSVLRGETTQDSIDYMRDRGIITDSKWVQLTKIQDDIVKKEQKLVENIKLVGLSVVTGAPLDRDNKDYKAAVNDYYNKVSSERDPLSEEVKSATTQIARQTSIVPESVRGQIRQLLASQNVDMVSQGVDYISRLQDFAPQAMDNIPKDEKAFALMVDESVRGGMTINEAVANAKKFVYETPESEKKVIQEQFNNSTFRKDNLDSLNDFIDDKFDPIFGAQPEAPMGMVGDYNVLVKQYYTNTRNLEQARRLASKDLERVWGRTWVNGELQLMRTPPEMVYGTGDKQEWMKNQVDGLKKKFLISEDSKLIITSDVITSRQKPVSYGLWIRDKDGLETPVIDEKNNAARWIPSYTETEEYQKEKEQVNMQVEKAMQRQSTVMGIRSGQIKTPTPQLMGL